MPYFVYRRQGRLALKKLAEFAAYREASVFARGARGQLPPAGGASVRVIFAPNELEAEALLRETRAPEPLVGDDY